MRKHLLLFVYLSAACNLMAADPIVNGKSGQAREILAKMSLEEKAQCVVGLKRDLFPPTNAGIAGRTVPFPQFGVPSLTLADGTAGVRLSRRAAERATAFPDNMALASSWDSNLAQKVGAAVAYEAVGYNVNIMLAPGLNIIRNPLCGRNFEYFSEDPLISGRMAAGYVLGIQSRGVAASAKHFTCNNQETNRGHNDVIISERALREIYLKGFEICVKESNPWTIMSSYNSLGGSPVQEQRRLLTDILRNEWGFDGLVMTDWSIVPHNTAAQLHAGNDLYMPGDDHQVEAIVSGVKDGSIKEEDLDSACLRVLRLAERCGKEQGSQAPDLSKGAALAKEAACETAVLMKNENTLPLPAGSSVALFGVRSYDLVNTGSGAGFVVSPYVSQINESFKKAGVRIDSEIDDLYSKYVQFASADIEYNEKIKVHIGLPLLPELEISKTLIDKAASRNDCAVITIGRSAEEGKDRPLKDDYYLSATEKALIEDVCSAFHAQGKKVTVVMNIAGIIETESWKGLPDAVLNIWLPGQEGGNAVYDLLYGVANPSGKLAVTFPVDYFDSPSAMNFPYNRPKSGANYDFTRYDEGIYVGYRYFSTKNIAVSYPFGHGLSYTSFEYSGLKVKSSKNKVSVTVTVKNCGAKAGKEAVGAYVCAPSAGLDKPAFELKAFSKTGLLQPGQSETLEMEIPSASLASFNDDKDRWETAKGTYQLYIGTDVANLRLKTTFRK